MSPSWLLHSGKGPSVEAVWMNRARRLITMYDFQTHYLIFALFGWLSLSVNKNFFIIICLLFTNLIQLSSQNPEIQVSLYSFLFCQQSLRNIGKKWKALASEQDVAIISFVSTYNWKPHAMSTETCLMISSRMMTVLMLCFILIALVTRESLCIYRKTTEDGLEKYSSKFTIYPKEKKKIVFVPRMDSQTFSGQRLHDTVVHVLLSQAAQKKSKEGNSLPFSSLSFVWNSLEMLLWCHFSVCNETTSSTESRKSM